LKGNEIVHMGGLLIDMQLYISVGVE